MTSTAEAAAPTSAAHSFKVVVAGSFAVGKTTLIQAISDTEVVGTEAPTSGSESLVKDTTTVGTEYGTLSVGDGDGSVELLLHGLPGQERFRFMWDIVSIGADGFLLVVDATRPDTWVESAPMVAHLEAQADAPILVAVNRGQDRPELIGLIREALGRDDLPVVACDVTDPTSARTVLVELLLLVLDHLGELDEDPDPEPGWEAP